MQFDVARVLAEKIGGDVAVDIGGDRRGREERLAGADDAGIGVQAEPEEKGKLGDFKRLDRRDLHLFLCSIRRVYFGRLKLSAVMPPSMTNQNIGHADYQFLPGRR